MRVLLLASFVFVSLWSKCLDNNITFSKYNYFGGLYYDIDIVGQKAYIVGTNGVDILDISDKTHPKLSARYDINSSVAIKSDGNTTYLANANYLTILDTYNESNITKLSSLDIKTKVNDIFIFDVYAALATDNGFTIVNITNPKTTVETGKVNTDTPVTKVVVDGNYSYVVEEAKGFSIIDLSSKILPASVSFFETEGYTLDIYVDGNYAYLAIGSNPSTVEGILVVDISDKNDPTLIGDYYDFQTLKDARSLYAKGNYLYVMDDFNGLVILDISNKAVPSYVGTYNLSGYVYNLEFQDGYFYIANSIDGLYILKDNNDTSLTFQSRYLTSGETTSSHIVSNKYMYLTDNFNGVLMFDIADKNETKLLSSYKTKGYAKNIKVVDSYAYVVDDSDGFKEQYGLSILDITNKSNPFLVGSIETNGNAKDIDVKGDYAYVADWENGLVVIDISNKTTPIVVNTFNSGGYIKKVILRDDYAFLVDTEKGMLILDISNPQNPTQISSFDTVGTLQDLTLVDNRVFLADGFEGINVLDITDINNPVSISNYKNSDFFNGIQSNGKNTFAIVKNVGILAFDTLESNVTKYLNSYKISGNMYNLLVESNIAYISNGFYGLQMIELCGYLSVEQAIEYGKKICMDNPSICGIDTTNKISSSTITSQSQGWSLMGTSVNISDMSIFNGVKTVWKYDQNGWSAYSLDVNISQTLQNANIPTLNSINENEGFWINK